MTKKPPKSDQDSDFAQAMDGVRPLKPTDRHLNEKKPTFKRKAPVDFSDDIPIPSPRPSSFYEPEHCQGDDVIHYNRAHLRPKELKQLKKGGLHIAAKLDLHQYTVEQAYEALDRFIHDCHQDNLRCVLIVHGKGTYSAGGQAILKKMLNRYLREHPNVLAFHSARPHHGGTGAVYALIKRYA